MRFTIYEDPHTHHFALLALPRGFHDGDKLPIAGVDRWFSSREEAVAALPDLFSRDDRCAGVEVPERPAADRAKD